MYYSVGTIVVVIANSLGLYQQNQKGIHGFEESLSSSTCILQKDVTKKVKDDIGRTTEFDSHSLSF